MTKPENDSANEAIAAAANTAARVDAHIEAEAHAEPEEVVDTRNAKQVAIDEAKEIFSVVGVALLLVLILRTFLFQPFTIPSASMEPNLYEGDYIIVSKWDYGISKYSFPITLPFIEGRIMNHAPTRGDVVVFKLPRDNKTDYIKRVIGLPGDTVQMRQDQLYINGKPVPATDLGPVEAKDFPGRYATAYSEALPDGRTHKMQDMVKDGRADDTGEFVVPAGNYFVMGDNRDNSLDSRFSPEDPYEPGVGFVPEANLEGRAVLVLMSWKEGSSLWKPWTWLNFHWNRFFKPLH
ncbi:hypothetical protein MMA231_02050 [Asticcacaulis sp. MM231]|uniref:signal peptidase I n=1 Tax=Asticcacaulis sp. MM231 TaxID=3157666 RepID=UPI0032D58542